VKNIQEDREEITSCMKLTLDEDNISKKYRILDILSIAIENDREIPV